MFAKRPNTFISYRRDDTIGHVGRLHDRLASKWGGNRIYWDIDNIPPGDDFLMAIDNTLTNCDLVLLVIGPKWLNATDSSGDRRLEKDNDFHRLEIERAISLDKRLIPVLVNGATLPAADSLPPSIRPLTTKNAFDISDKRFDFDSAKLIQSIETWFATVSAGPQTKSNPESKRTGSQSSTARDWKEDLKERAAPTHDGADRKVLLPTALSKLLEPSKKWMKVSPQVAVNHPLYGNRGLMIYFAIMTVLLPIQASYSFLAEWNDHSALPLVEAFSTTNPVWIYMRTNAIVSIIVAFVILMLISMKISNFRVLAMSCLAWGWPMSKFFGLSDPVSPYVSSVVANSFVVWFLACIVLGPYLHFSKRIRVTYEHSVRRTTDA